jgi:hypothetical protein
MLEKLAISRQNKGHLESDQESGSVSNVSTNLKEEEPPRIGKLRFLKSGKVVMRIQLPG